MSKVSWHDESPRSGPPSASQRHRARARNRRPSGSSTTISPSRESPSTQLRLGTCGRKPLRRTTGDSVAESQTAGNTLGSADAGGRPSYHRPRRRCAPRGDSRTSRRCQELEQGGAGACRPPVDPGRGRSGRAKRSPWAKWPSAPRTRPGLGPLVVADARGYAHPTHR